LVKAPTGRLAQAVGVYGFGKGVAQRGLKAATKSKISWVSNRPVQSLYLCTLCKGVGKKLAKKTRNYDLALQSFVLSETLRPFSWKKRPQTSKSMKSVLLGSS
jgi:hypothetical protein